MLIILIKSDNIEETYAWYIALSLSRIFHIWISCSDTFVYWYSPPMYCEHQDRPLGECRGRTLLLYPDPAGVTHGNSPMVHPTPLWPALRGGEQGRHLKARTLIWWRRPPRDGWEPRTALAAVVTVWAGLAFHPQSSSQILTKERKWRSVSDGWDWSPFLENKTLLYFQTL